MELPRNSYRETGMAASTASLAPADDILSVLEVERQTPPLEELKSSISHEQDITLDPIPGIELLEITPQPSKHESTHASESSIDMHTFPPNPEVEAVARTSHHRRIERIQLFALCFSIFLLGWNDGSAGPLL